MGQKNNQMLVPCCHRKGRPRTAEIGCLRWALQVAITELDGEACRLTSTEVRFVDDAGGRQLLGRGH